MPGPVTAFPAPDIHANRPAAGSGAVLFPCTTHGLVYRSDGTSWITWATLGTAGAYVAGGTDVAVADGGTGASSASAARTNLGLVIGTDVEAHDADLTTIAGLSPSNDDVLQRKAGAWTNRTIAQLIADLSAGGLTGGSALTVEEVDGSPTDSAVTKIVFPNGTLAIVGHVATYTPSGGGGSALTVKDEGSNLDTAVTSIDFVGAGVVATNSTHAVTVTIAGGGGSGVGEKLYLAANFR